MDYKIFIEMLYADRMVIIFVGLFWFLTAMMMYRNVGMGFQRISKNIMVGFSLFIVILFTLMPVPSFVQSQTAISAYVAEKSNETQMTAVRIAMIDACDDGIVQGYEYMNVKDGFKDDVNRIVDEKSSFSMNLDASENAPAALKVNKLPICEFMKIT